MTPAPPPSGPVNLTVIRWLTFLMFTMFAMTTDAVGVIIPAVIREYGLSMTAAGAFHYTTMTAIALSGGLLGHLADRLGRKRTILLGLAAYATSSYLFAAGNSFGFFLALLALSGTAIGIYKTGALALIGDISRSSREHTSTMNTIEGFFGVGAIIGPAIVTALLAAGTSWKWLYIVAGTICVVLMVTAWTVRYPTPASAAAESVDLRRTLAMGRDPYAMLFSLGIMCYVAVESAVYVWMPTLLAGYRGSATWLAAYALTVFFVLRAGGRFLGAWMLGHQPWTRVMAIVSGGIFLCFLGSVTMGVGAAVWLLPLSGIFMSVVYPTLNSKGISGFQKTQHGAVAGVILFFTCVGAVAGPLAMGALGDWTGRPITGFVLATILAGVLFVGLLWNWMTDPARPRLLALEQSEYAPASGDAASMVPETSA